MTTTFTPPGPAHARKKSGKRKKVLFVSAVLAVVLVPLAAWAAVKLYGFGQIDVQAGDTGTVSVLGGEQFPLSLQPSLAPGVDSAVRLAVKNDNDYPIAITSLIVKRGSLVVSGGTAAQCQVGLGESGTVAVFPANNGDAAVNNSRAFAISDAITLAPGEAQWVQFPAVFTQSAAASKLCGVKADYAVEGVVGS